MISLFLLLLFHLSLGHEDTPVIDASTDPCKCETRIFDVDEMNGTMKFKQSRYDTYFKSTVIFHSIASVEH